jgi:hypothetical protein
VASNSLRHSTLNIGQRCALTSCKQYGRSFYKSPCSSAFPHNSGTSKYNIYYNTPLLFFHSRCNSRPFVLGRLIKNRYSIQFLLLAAVSSTRRFSILMSIDLKLSNSLLIWQWKQQLVDSIILLQMPARQPAHMTVPR